MSGLLLAMGLRSDDMFYVAALPLHLNVQSSLARRMQLLMSGLLWSRTTEMREILFPVPFVLEIIYIKCTLHDLESTSQLYFGSTTNKL